MKCSNLEMEELISQLARIQEVIQNVSNSSTDKSIGLSIIGALGGIVSLVGSRSPHPGLNVLLQAAGTATKFLASRAQEKNETKKKETIQGALSKALAILSQFIEQYEKCVKMMKEDSDSGVKNEKLINILYKRTKLLLDLKALKGSLDNLFCYFSSVNLEKLANLQKKQSTCMKTGQAVFDIGWNLFLAQKKWLEKGTLCEEAKKIEKVISQLRTTDTRFT